jgi:hypothetical protein
MNSDPRDFDFKFDFSMQTKTPNCSCCVVTFWSHTSDDARCVKDGRPAWHGRDDLSAAIERALTQALGEERARLVLTDTIVAVERTLGGRKEDGRKEKKKKRRKKKENRRLIEYLAMLRAWEAERREGEAIPLTEFLDQHMYAFDLAFIRGQECAYKVAAHAAYIKAALTLYRRRVGDTALHQVLEGRWFKELAKGLITAWEKDDDNSEVVGTTIVEGGEEVARFELDDQGRLRVIDVRYVVESD